MRHIKTFESWSEGDIDDIQSFIRSELGSYDLLHYGFDYIEVRLHDREDQSKIQSAVDSLIDKFNDAIKEIYTEETGWFKVYFKKVLESKMSSDYRKWRRTHVSYRGIANDDGPLDSPNSDCSGMLGRGLYTTPSSNRKMSKSYGKVYIVVNGRPSKPKVFNTLNEWEVWFQQHLILPISKQKGNNYPNRRDFEAKTTIEEEMLKLGYDGIEIRGREMVNFKPDGVLFFEKEWQVEDYYHKTVKLKENKQ